MLAVFFNLSRQRQIAAIALPMVLSNLCVPLLGLVDTAVVGHLNDARYLGGVALGGSVISLVYFLFSFLRMSTTGLTAQAHGRNSEAETIHCLQQGISLALVLSIVLLCAQQPIAQLLIYFSDASTDVTSQAVIYFKLRIWSAPATLVNLVLMGWFLGKQNARYPMWMLLWGNIINIVLDLLFVMGLDWTTEGVALASVLADYATLLLAMYLLHKSAGAQIFSALKPRTFNLQGSRQLLALNRDIFLRSLCLQAVFVFIAFQGATYGDNIVAANAVLLSFLMLVSYALDGLAYAAESLVGRAIGRNNVTELSANLGILALWCLILSLLFSLSYALLGHNFVALLTSLVSVQQQAAQYLNWMILLPLVASWAYLLDGVFIGATQGKQLRNSMLLALLGFMLCFYLLSHWQNHALWAALCVFMALRSVILAYYLLQQWRQQLFFGIRLKSANV
ncbi:MATE family efflux transporter [Rheinheimera baltica]|uniref:MATE family efflux transporter n=1 Tax=Rheinheimera baltica TaxID=67576 RepID=UPI00273EB7A4|nr:MATE family efflux transporter [Rheinheimera baltica]MDP5148884.1 MATE family efflux transporter [Rheinheimera baltica]